MMLRRRFLRGAAGAFLALPMLEAMNTAWAAGTGFPKRFVVFFTANGTVPSAWTPGPNFALSPILQPLAPHRDDIIVIGGLDMKSSGGDGKGHNRGVGCLLTGVEPVGGNDGDDSYANGISVDQRIAEVAGGDTPFASVELGVHVRSTLPRGRMVYTGPGEPVPPEDNPFAAFTRLFGGFGEDDGQAEALVARRRSVLDAVMEDFHRLDGRLGSQDRLKLEAHLDAVRGVEQRLDALAGVSEACEPPVQPESFNHYNASRFPEVGALQMELLVMALACGLTNVASLMWSTALSGMVHTWLGQTLDHHSYSHASDPASTEALIAIDTWYAERFADLLARCKEIPEGDGTLLDNTVVFWGSELGKGQPHYCSKIPVVLAGSCGGYFATGQHVQYDAVSHNNLLLNFLEAMDVPDATFGDPAWCDGPLAEVKA
jgi:hypothetical protein